tara:strand:- start:165 stop:452 length:288 start_codon:yes stop_codon:yes gene_type:complete
MWTSKVRHHAHPVASTARLIAALCVAGACDHSLACSTCHVVLQQEVFSELDAVDDEEMDMLDLAFGLEDTSRLGCQVKVSKLLEGKKITLPTERF